MPRILGLDITPYAVRGALIKTAFGKTELLRYIEIPIPEAPTTGAGAAGSDAAATGTQSGGNSTAPQNEQTFSDARREHEREAVRQALLACEQPPDSVATTLPGNIASIRTLTLPAAAEKRINEVLPFELEALIPFPIEEALLAEQPIERIEDKVKLLVCAIPKARVVSKLTELRSAGADLRHLSVSPVAFDGLAVVVKELAGAGPHVVFDLGDKQTDVCILNKGRAELARTISIGLVDLPDASDSLVRDLVQTLSGFRAQGGAQPVGYSLTGGGSNPPDAAAWLSQKLSLPIEIAQLPEASGLDLSQRPLFARALAVACRATRSRHMELLQGDLAPKRTIGAIRKNAPALALGAACVVFSFGFSTCMQRKILNEEHAQLETQLAAMTKEVLGEQTTSAARARDLLGKGRRIADPLPRFDAFDALGAISNAIASEIKHDTRRLHIELDETGREGRFELQGAVQSIQQRDQIAMELEKHECIEELEKGPTTPGVGEQTVNYKLEGVLRCPGQAEEPTKNKNKGRR